RSHTAAAATLTLRLLSRFLVSPLHGEITVPWCPHDARPARSPAVALRRDGDAVRGVSVATRRTRGVAVAADSQATYPDCCAAATRAATRAAPHRAPGRLLPARPAAPASCMGRSALLAGIETRRT